MVGKLLILMLLSVSLYASALDSTIKDLVDEKQYEKHKRLIDILFQKEQDYYAGERVNVVKVAKVLKENGLLQLFYDKPTMTHITFTTSSKPVLFLKIVNDILLQMGFTYYLTDNVVFEGGKMTWKIQYMGNYVVDPLILAQRLEGYDAIIASIKKDAYNRFTYGLNLHDAKLDVPRLKPYESVEVKRAINDIWFDVSLGKFAVLQPLPGSLWYPEVVLYDKDLNIIKVVKRDEVRKTLYIDLTKQTRYISVSDIYQLENLKGGIRIKLRGER